MKNENEDRLHEMLCAYVLGEGTAEERAEVERELAASPELRAEREKIEATIGLVRGAIGGPETLSPGVAAEVLASVRPSPVTSRPWYRLSSVRMAAGVAVLLGGFAVWALNSQSSRTRPAELAECEDPATDRESIAARRGQSLDDQVAMAGKNEKRDAPEADRLAGSVAKDGNASQLAAASGAEFKEAAEVVRRLGYTQSELQERVEHFASQQRALPTAPAVGQSAGGHKLSADEGRARDSWPASGIPEAIPLDSVAVGSTHNWKVHPGFDAGSPSAVAPGRAGAIPTAGATPTPGAIWRYADVGLGLGEGDAAAEPIIESIEWAAVGGMKAEKLKGLGYVGESPNSEAARLNALGYSGVDADSGSDFYLGKGMLAKKRESLTPEQRELYLDEECRRILSSCYRRPNERPRDMFFRFWGDNPFEIAALDAQSTFSVDVDTASYALARRYLNEGNLPTKAQVRTEEFVNYFKADVPAPSEGTFAVHTDLAPSRFSSDASRSMLRVVVRGREVARTERKPLALTFVIDVSGSMREQNRLEMVKHTLRLLLAQLDANDSIAVVAFSDEARMILPMTSAGNRGLIESALFPLQPSGSTNSQGGLKMGYEAALAGINPNATNRVVFLSDGVANVGITDANQITNEVQRIREKGIYLNTIGVGMNNHNDVLLEQLADKGDGVCNYVDSPEEAKRVMVDGFTGAFEPIARDVKIQVEFDPAQVARYRLLGYENRAVADKDFRNDKVDAGEVGAGHQVTALYEIERTGAAPVEEKPLAVVRLRWKAPRTAGTSANAETEQSTELEKPVLAAQATSFEGAGVGYRRAVIVAQFAEILRRSEHARGDSLDVLIAEAAKLEREVQDAEFTELVLLMQKSRALILARQPVCDDLCQTVDLIRRNHLLRAERELLAQEQDSKLVDELERENRELEARIRELLRRRIEGK